MFIPQPNKVLVSPISDESVVNGIITSFKKQVNHTIGEVISVGSECLNVTQGDIVVFGKVGVVKYEENLIIDYENILGIMGTHSEEPKQ